ncbi:MAG: hypothetical protein HGA87_02295 [Desulfobulbaceae bacterium]|nr:hypothetical protein [Desulfobulbaceae bacterium]
MTMIEFLKPRLCGERFSQTSIPLEFLKDLAVLEEMIFEVAKWKYLKNHPNRVRTPRGFTDGLELKLTGIEDGSAIPIISLFISSLTLQGIEPANSYYVEQARDSIVNAIYAAENHQTTESFLPEKSLSYFDRIGRSLKENEFIEFTTPSNPITARLSKETRRRLLLESSNVREFSDDVTIRGSIPQADQDEMQFKLLLSDGNKIPGPIPNQHFETIIQAFNEFRNGSKVIIQGVGKYNRQNRLISMESIEHISLLDPLDISERLDELKNLNDGWLDGEGTAPNPEVLNWLSNSFTRYYSAELPLPYIYPTAEGGIQVEWSLPPNDVSLEIDLTTHQGEWHCLNLNTNEEETDTFNLNEGSDWARLIDVIQHIGSSEV